MNLPEVILRAILRSQYYQLCRETLHDYDDCVKEIQSKVEFLEPFIGSSKNPSSAFVLLYRLFALRLSSRQLHAMLRSKQSPFSKGIALLYVRCAVHPEAQWAFYEEVIEDDTELVVHDKRPPQRVASICKDLILGQRFCNVIFF